MKKQKSPVVRDAFETAAKFGALADAETDPEKKRRLINDAEQALRTAFWLAGRY